MSDPGKTLGEVHRVLKPGAGLGVAILNRTGLWTVWRRLTRLVVRSLWRQATFLRPRELRRLMDEHGFRELRWRGSVHFLPIFGGRAVRYLERWEALAARWMPARATFVVTTGRRV